MRRNDFITYVPLNAVTAMRLYITHGKHASLHLKVYTYNGAEANYTIDTPLFTSLRKHKAYLADTMTELFAQYAPHIRVES